MHFIHITMCLEEFLHQNAMFFKKMIFPDFRLIEPVARLIENAIKILVIVCLARLVLDQSKLIFDQSNLIFDRSKINQRVFKKNLFSRVHHTVHTFSKSFLSFLLRPIHFKLIFVVFFLISLKVFAFKCR